MCSKSSTFKLFTGKLQIFTRDTVLNYLERYLLVIIC